MCFNAVHPITIQDGLSPLYVASQEGHTDVVDILVKAGADVNQAITVVCLFVNELGVHDAQICVYFKEIVFLPLYLLE